MSSSRSTDDPEEEHPGPLFPPYDEGEMTAMLQDQCLPYLHHGATWDSIPQHDDHYGAPQYHPQSYLAQHGDWGHERNRYTLPASRNLHRTLEHDDAAGLSAHLQSMSLDSNWNPDAKDDSGSAAGSAHDDRGQGIWGAHPQQLPHQGQRHDYASSSQQYPHESARGSHKQLSVEDALQSGDDEHREQDSRSQPNYNHPDSQFYSRTAPRSSDHEGSSSHISPRGRGFVYRPPGGRRIDEVYLPTATGGTFVVRYRSHSLMIHPVDDFDYYNHNPGPLTKTQEANQRHAATLLVKPSEMDFGRPPIRHLSDRPLNDLIPVSLERYAEKIPSRTEPGYYPPRASTIAMTMPHPGPMGRRSEGDRPLADYTSRVAFGSSDVRNEDKKVERYEKEGRIEARKAPIPKHLLPRNDWRREPGTSGPDDRGKLGKNASVGNCAEYEALQQLLLSLPHQKDLGVYTFAHAGRKPLAFCDKCRELVINIVNEYRDLKVIDAVTGDTYSYRHSFEAVSYSKYSSS